MSSVSKWFLIFALSMVPAVVLADDFGFSFSYGHRSYYSSVVVGSSEVSEEVVYYPVYPVVRYYSIYPLYYETYPVYSVYPVCRYPIRAYYCPVRYTDRFHGRDFRHDGRSGNWRNSGDRRNSGNWHNNVPNRGNSGSGRRPDVNRNSGGGRNSVPQSGHRGGRR